MHLAACGQGSQAAPSWQCDDKGCRVRCAAEEANMSAQCMILTQSAAGFWERQACGERPCPVDCTYSAWQNWEACNKECESGLKYRKRLVLVEPQFGGKSCPNIG